MSPFKKSPIRIIYASASGNTASVAEKVAELLEISGRAASPISADRFDIAELRALDFAIFATSTWEHGEIHPFYTPFLKALDKVNLAHLGAAFIGTGDRRYEPVLFCKGMEILRERVLQCGAVEITSPLRLDGEPRACFDTVLPNWVNKFAEQLNTR